MEHKYTEKCDVQNIYRNQILLKWAVMKIFKIFLKHHKVTCLNLLKAIAYGLFIFKNKFQKENQTSF